MSDDTGEDEGEERRDLARGAASLRSEVKGLRSRVQILRAERTAMAGRRYALEVIVEGLREKLDGIGAAAERGSLDEVRELVRQAQLVAEGRGSAAGGLESERLAQLEEMQRLEVKVADLKEKVAGYRSERDALREQVGTVEREYQVELEDLQGRFDEADAERARLRAEVEAGARQRAAALESVVQQARDRAAQLERASRALCSRAGELREALDAPAARPEA